MYLNKLASGRHNDSSRSLKSGYRAIPSRDDKNHIRELERQLRRKDAALAETAAFLVLRKKKLNAYWGEAKMRATDLVARTVSAR
ncbi:hypothetical protein [Pseudomonas fluorescens]